MDQRTDWEWNINPLLFISFMNAANKRINDRMMITVFQTADIYLKINAGVGKFITAHDRWFIFFRSIYIFNDTLRYFFCHFHYPFQITIIGNTYSNTDRKTGIPLIIIFDNCCRNFCIRYGHNIVCAFH